MTNLSLAKTNISPPVAVTVNSTTLLCGFTRFVGSPVETSFHTGPSATASEAAADITPRASGSDPGQPAPTVELGLHLRVTSHQLPLRCCAWRSLHGPDSACAPAFRTHSLVPWLAFATDAQCIRELLCIDSVFGCASTSTIGAVLTMLPAPLNVALGGAPNSCATLGGPWHTSPEQGTADGGGLSPGRGIRASYTSKPASLSPCTSSSLVAKNTSPPGFAVVQEQRVFGARAGGDQEDIAVLPLIRV